MIRHMIRSRTLSRMASRCSCHCDTRVSARFYSRSAIHLREKTIPSDLARELEVSRQEYSKQVSQLRKQYAEEVARQRASDEAAAEARQREITRKRLEHERLKNIRSGQNAIRQRQREAARAAEFAEELRIAQMERDAKKARYDRARQKIVDELEAEAHLWLTTPEEIEKAFTPETEQLLWARPNSVLGAPNPSLDTEFWRFESLTWHMDRTYPTPRELLLEDMLELAYEEANVDKEFWTPERLAEREALEEKAKLRAMVRDTGRRVLLKKQQEILQDRFSNEDKTQIPNAMPVPSLAVMTKTTAMEEEGVDVLLKDPTKFFEFDSDQTEHVSGKEEAGSTYGGPTLGAPVALKDFTAYGPHEKRPYPQPVGKLLKPDMRSQRQKKRAERQEKMWAAAQQELTEEEKLLAEVESVAEKKWGGEKIDYNNPPDYDSDDEEWEEGLNPETDSDILSIPRAQRYKEEDIAWVKAELEKKVQQQKELLRFELATATQEGGVKKEKSKDIERQLEEGTDEEVMEESELRSLGVDVDELNSLFESLSEEQMFSFLSMEKLQSNNLSEEEISEALRTVPGLTDDQINKIMQLEKSLASNDKVRAAYGRSDESEND